jgi:hypothetical protein
MTTMTDWAWLQWERAYPTVLGVGAGAISLCYAPEILHTIHANNWSVENIYLAIFTIATVASGFTFTTYTFLLTTESGFIGRAKQSIYYRHMLTYVLRATILGGLLAAATVPLLVMKTVPASVISVDNLLVAVWWGLTIGTGAAFFRAAYLFGIFAHQHH